MFEREIKFIYDFNLNKINRLGPYFTFEQLSTTDIHPAILHYISAEIDYLVFEDRQNLLKNSVFDYSGEKINYHFNQITAELKKTKRFSSEYIAKLILHACSFTINYLIRPKWTLAKFVFDEADIKSTNEIKQILNYIYYYKYLTKILISYINAKKILSMNREEFEVLLNKADALGAESYLSAIISNALKSMAEFFNIGEIKKFRVPLPAVELFLEEKELLQHLDVLNAEFGNDENSKFNMYDYLKALNKVMIEKKEEAPAVEEQVQFEGEKEVEPVVEEEITEHAAQETEVEKTIASVTGDEKHEPVVEEEQAVEAEDTEEESEIEIKQPTKLRIHVGEDNRIEPIFEEEKVPAENEDVIEDELETGEQLLDEGETDESDEKSFEEESLFVENDLAEEEVEDENSEVTEEPSANHNIIEVEHETAEEEAPKEDIPISKDELTPLERIIQIEKENEPEGESMFDMLKENFVQPQPSLPKLDLAELLERKEMTKIIETIFDYDIEDFANTLEEISQCKELEDAQSVINRTLVSRHIPRSNKEAEAFITIISEF
ncbi:MAG: hypothetical protein M1391_08180, partial [Bacteroidetes bacterium]|nr:hypothetical protein [Bacteroidota bacterium]